MNDKELKAAVKQLAEGLHSGLVAYAMEVLERIYQHKVADEIVAARNKHKEYAAEHPDYDVDAEFRRELIQVAFSNRASWSGGHSIKNLCEQVKREAAINKLDNPNRSW